MEAADREDQTGGNGRRRRGLEGREGECQNTSSNQTCQGKVHIKVHTASEAVEYAVVSVSYDESTLIYL